MSGRTLTAAVDTELGQQTTAPRYFVKLELDSGDVRLWSGLGDKDIFGETYTGVGRLGQIEPITETQEVVASGVRLSLMIIPTDDQPDAIDAFLNIALAEEYQGRPLTIWQAQVNHVTGAIIGDPFIRFKGALDVMEDSELPSLAVLRISAENRLIDFERVRRRLYTPEDQEDDYPVDTFFDEVAALQNREIILR